jgi:hypothetical protein
MRRKNHPWGGETDRGVLQCHRESGGVDVEKSCGTAAWRENREKRSTLVEGENSNEKLSLTTSVNIRITNLN